MSVSVLHMDSVLVVAKRGEVNSFSDLFSDECLYSWECYILVVVSWQEIDVFAACSKPFEGFKNFFVGFVY